ncbi:filamentous hemagglutinin N-terminal domain-containing protein [Aerosakkonema funiforme]|uniref:two-partner secretion domain-containing protein n=1 Tax=Aerosakkonema funiforme TaxID=1246630 RepID=UPI0035BABE4D
MKKYRSLVSTALGSAWACLLSANPTAAQIVPDATLPVNSIATPQGSTISIEGGTTKGGNLFHSFWEFSLPTGTEAYFHNTVDIQNIFTRVTGSSVSHIDGSIKANGVANLFLINPNGIIFGPNARLNVGGSFVASTASSIRFTDGIEFSASNPNTSPLLTINVPIGLQFGSNPGQITVNGPGHNLRTDPKTEAFIRDNRPVGLQVLDRTLALVGGEITLAGGNLTANTGRIELGSVAGDSSVTLIPIDPGFKLSYENVQNFQDIRLIGAASLDAVGSRGGDIRVRGRRVTLSDGSVIAANTLGSRSGGNLVVNASETVELIGTSADGKIRTGLFADTYSTGQGGNLTINTRTLLVRSGAAISASTYGAGKAGNLTVNASDLVQLIGGLDIAYLLARANPGSTGDAADLTINTATLLVQDGGQVGAGTFGSGRGGNLTVNASEQVQVSGISARPGFPSAIGPRAAPGSTGDAGNLTINTGTLIVRDRARVGARGLGEGNAGIVTINARSILLDNQGFISTDSQSLKADPNREQATIVLRSGNLILRQNSRLSTNAEGKNAIGGNININTDVIVASGDSDISANSKNFRGGQVRINSQGIFGSVPQMAPTSGSDITATGGTPELSGVVEIDTPAVNPNPGLHLVSLRLFDDSSLVVFSCYRRGSDRTQFLVTGRGGLPPTPYDELSSRYDLVSVRSRSAATPVQSVRKNSTSELSPELVEASAWTIASDGKVILTANPSNLMSGNSISASTCQATE